MSIIRFIGIGVHYVVNTFLALFLGGMLFLVVILLRDGEVPIPSFLVDTLDEELADQGFRVEFDRLQLDLRGIIFAHSTQIFAEGNTDPLFESDLMLVKFSIIRLLVGEFTPSEISLADAALYCPAVISPSGQREPMVHNLYINARRQGQDWLLDTFILQMLGARVHINGNVFTPLPGMESKSHDKKLNIDGLYMEICRSLIELQEPFSKIEDLILRIELSGERKAPLEILAQVYMSGFFDEATKVKLGAGSSRLRAKLGVDGILRPDGLGQVSLNSLQWQDDVETGFSEAHVRLDNGLDGFTSMPLAAEIYSYNIKAWGLPFDGAFGSLNLRDLKSTGTIKGHIILKSGLNWLAVDGPFHPKDESGSLNIRARWNPTFFLQSTEIPAEDIPTDISIAGRPYWKASVDFLPGLKPRNSQFDVRFNQLNYHQLHLEAARVKGRITEDEIELYSVDLYARDYAVKGNYQQQFSTGNYRFQAKGTVWPSDLNIFIPDQWWKDLWADFTFNQTPPEAEIDMSGQYGANGAKNKIYGSAKLRDVKYKDDPIDMARSRIWQNVQHLDLFDFNVETKDGRAAVELHWEYLPNGENDYISFLARTHLPLLQGANMAGPSVVPIAKKFPSDEIPYLDLAGIVYGEHSIHADDLYVKGSVFFPGPFEFEDVRFDNGSFLFELTPEQIKVSQGRLGLGGGKTALYTVVQRQPNGGLYVENAKISIIDAKLYGLYEAIPFLRVARAKQEALERIKAAKKARSDKDNDDDDDDDKAPRTFEERYAGDVKLFFDTHGQLPDLNTFSGSGTLVLTDANLGQLHLLGGLSSFLYSIGLHLGTLNFTNAQTDFTLARSNLNFPNGQVSGATGEIVTNGNFNIDQESLDFLISLHPFGNMETPIFDEIFSIFSPLANSIEVQLTGTLTKPDYEVSVKPMGVFFGQAKVENLNADVIPPLKKKPNQATTDKSSQ
ncbi:hypothetical protein [Cerasicoccus arenae]|uniref:AsmA-like C-terminal domain-containing protein n=1 Tax=Cerasicoccus arenae TaxID=424488 RepID=A0A8J3DC97_9BACT|nr:hypothetical protein [Cerasicoccus arenae]MBK1858407.1 hypothetical protein [Cerasicoccus arenae]GHC02345.1 hypothetical protein GCM10007047_18620 [Cerasicoccus arenae]